MSKYTCTFLHFTLVCIFPKKNACHHLYTFTGDVSWIKLIRPADVVPSFLPSKDWRQSYNFVVVKKESSGKVKKIRFNSHKKIFFWAKPQGLNN